MKYGTRYQVFRVRTETSTTLKISAGASFRGMYQVPGTIYVHTRSTTKANVRISTCWHTTGTGKTGTLDIHRVYRRNEDYSKHLDSKYSRVRSYIRRTLRLLQCIIHISNNVDHDHCSALKHLRMKLLL